MNTDTHYKSFLWTALMLLTMVGTAQERVSKTIEKSFSLSENGELQLENKYGNITLTGWDQNKVKVVMDVKVNHRKREDAKELLDRIRPEIKSNSSFISVVSVIANRNSGWFADFFNKANPIDTDRSRVQIDYEVFLPKKAKLDITNRFGDIFIEDWTGPLHVVLEHGDLWLNDGLNKADIKLTFGKIRAKDLDYATIMLENGELTMDEAKNLRLTTEGSEIKIGKANALELDSNKDEIAINEVGSVFGSLKFSTFKLQKLIDDVGLDLKIADFVIYGIGQPDAQIIIEQESSDITLNVGEFSHRFDATLEQGVVRLPKNFENVRSDMLDNGKKLRKIEATYGDSKTGHISISGSKGIVTIND